jgi:hypothetical protein
MSIPPAIAGPVLAAFLIELAFYLVPGFEEAREALAQRFRPPVLALVMTASADLPFCVYGGFRWPALAALAGIAATVSFWYVALPRGAAFDAGFLVLLAALGLSRVFAWIYADPMPHLHVDVLGKLALIRLGAMAILIFRRAGGIGFGFIPRKREWMSGLRHFLYLLPVAALLAMALHVAAWHAPALVWWKTALIAVATFFGILWVVALSEEFLFRGLLQQWIGGTPGLIAASLVFGLAHLWFRGFPNWRVAIIAAVAGGFYGRAYQKAGTIRAPMVTHALIVTVWKVLF